MLLSLVSKPDAHDRRKRLPSSIEVCFDRGEDSIPVWDNGMVVDWVQFAAERISFRTGFGPRPGSPRLIYEGLSTESAMRIGKRIRVIVEEIILVILDPLFSSLYCKASFEIGETGPRVLSRALLRNLESTTDTQCSRKLGSTPGMSGRDGTGKK
ncbi:hypothetical protein NUW54_g5134 [Trametes sanguinea]|uniref:Uncharacterized protein n=1 Tax=Trametes sanguinea TaxID=158606 RepID=A0ACC1PVZ7_9APHY|nr:hypothetical protein NUW54_g5134 [Trametes sanguinea]